MSLSQRSVAGSIPRTSEYFLQILKWPERPFGQFDRNKPLEAVAGRSNILNSCTNSVNFRFFSINLSPDVCSIKVGSNFLVMGMDLTVSLGHPYRLTDLKFQSDSFGVPGWNPTEFDIC